MSLRAASWLSLVVATSCAAFGGFALRDAEAQGLALRKRIVRKPKPPRPEKPSPPDEYIPPSGDPNPKASVKLPIEVMGSAATQVTVPLNLTKQRAKAAKRLHLTLHGIEYPNQASVRANNAAWVPLTNETCLIEGQGLNYGGIGGALTTFRLSVPVSGLAAGYNTVSFRFNGTDGVSSGFRVLKVDLLDSANQLLLNGAGFAQDDPQTWTAPRPGAAEIAAGELLWKTAALKEFPGSSVTLRARCADCHAHDGRDLKYFNYSNLSIIERSKFHGLSQVQGEQIASYIRAHTGPAPGRPWNPPYQPGPGLDSKPVAEWAAGAGLEWVLEKDSQMLPYLFPNGITKEAVATTQTLNMRELPIAMLLPDWNHWVPRVHPKDAFPVEFLGNATELWYRGLRERLVGAAAEYYWHPGGYSPLANELFAYEMSVGSPGTELEFAL